MSLINDVKKTLRDTGVEMDADDVADVLAMQPRYPRGVTRMQTAHALQALCATDVGVIRTRPGLYQHRHVPAVVPILGSTLQAPPDPAIRPHPRAVLVRTTEPQAAPILLIIEAPYVHRQLTSLTGATPSPAQLDALSTHLCELVTLRLARPGHLTWQPSATATAAALTRHQYERRDIIVLASRDVVREATLTAQQLGRPLRICTFGTATAFDQAPADPEIAEVFAIDANDLRRRCAPNTVAPELPQQPLTTARLPHATPPARHSTLDSLWYLDDTLYRRPIDGVTGRGNTHSLKRQALLVGQTYAHRWSDVVNDEARDLLNANNDGLIVPGRLYADLLTFAETHGLPPHGSHLIKDHLRRGFWTAIRRDHPNAHPQPAA